MSKPILFCGQGCGAAAVEMLTGVFGRFEQIGIRPDKVLASSGSALFTSLYYSDHNTNWFLKMMQEKAFSDFAKLDLLQGGKTVLGLSNYVYDNSGLFELLKKELTAKAALTVTVSVTRIKGMVGEMKPATPSTVLAATSIPVVFPPVLMNGYLYCDGGVKNNVPVPPMNELSNYEHVYVFLAPPAVYEEPSNLIDTGINLLNAIMDREIEQFNEAGYDKVENVTVIQLPSLLSGGLLNWSEGLELCDAAYEYTKEIVG